MINAVSQFRDAIHVAGMEPPDVIQPGRLYRFPGAKKRNGNTAGWCRLFDDGLGGSWLLPQTKGSNESAYGGMP